MTDKVDPSRRGFLKALVGLSAVVVVGGAGTGIIKNLVSPAVGLTDFPETQLFWNDPNSSASAPVPLKASTFPPESSGVWIYYYPLSDEPNFLIRFKDEVKPATVTIDATGATYTFTGGVGPASEVNGTSVAANSIVSFSAICQHLGCIAPIIHYYPPGTMTTLPASVQSKIKTEFTKELYPNGSFVHGVIHCNCHGSTYNPFQGGGIITHPTERPLPFVSLKYDSLTDTLYAKKLTGPVVFGHPSDLTGGHAISNLRKAVVTKIATN